MSEVEVVKVVSSMKAKVEEGRSVAVYLLDNGCFQIEWARPDGDPQSRVQHLSRVGLTPESFAATAQVAFAMFEKLASEDDEEPGSDQEPASDDDRADAERFRKWCDASCYRPAEAAKILADCITPAQIAEAIDKLS